MPLRRIALGAVAVLSVAAASFALGSWEAARSAARDAARNDLRIDELRNELAHAILQARQASAATTGTGTEVNAEATQSAGAHAALVDEIKHQLQAEMGLAPVRLLRQRRQSFVELYSYDNDGKSSYGTAGYLGNGYFITVKHGVIALGVDADQPADSARKVTSIKLIVRGRAIPATVVDAGRARVEVDGGDWAVLKVHERVDLPALRVNLGFQFDFADTIFRLGNDYSKGIILSSGYIGQRTTNGLVTCLTDGHPGVSGGGVLDQNGDLVGIPIGRMQGDYRFSFILPLRAEMLRKVSGVQEAPPNTERTSD